MKIRFIFCLLFTLTLSSHADLAGGGGGGHVDFTPVLLAYLFMALFGGLFGSIKALSSGGGAIHLLAIIFLITCIFNIFTIFILKIIYNVLSHFTGKNYDNPEILDKCTFISFLVMILSSMILASYYIFEKIQPFLDSLKNWLQ